MGTVCCPDNELTLVRVDVATGQIVGEPITLPGGAPFAVAAGHVWFIEERGALYGLNVDTLEVDDAVSGFDWPAGGFPDPSTELDPGQLAAWVTNSDQDSVTRIDLADPSSAVPEGRLVVQLNSGIEVLSQGESRTVPVGGERIVAYDLSPDGSKVLAASYVTEPTHYTRKDKLLTIDTSSGERTTLVRASPTEDLGPAIWSPDSGEVAYRLSTLAVDPATEHPGEPTAQTICVVDVITLESRCSPDLGTVDGFSWSPDGQRLVVDGVGGDLPLRVLNLSTGQVSDLASPNDPELVDALGGQPPDSFVFAKWSPSGKYVATRRTCAPRRSSTQAAGSLCWVTRRRSSPKSCWVTRRRSSPKSSPGLRRKISWPTQSASLLTPSPTSSPWTPPPERTRCSSRPGRASTPRSSPTWLGARAGGGWRSRSSSGPSTSRSLWSSSTWPERSQTRLSSWLRRMKPRF